MTSCKQKEKSWLTDNSKALKFRAAVKIGRLFGDNYGRRVMNRRVQEQILTGLQCFVYFATAHVQPCLYFVENMERLDSIIT